MIREIISLKDEKIQLAKGLTSAKARLNNNKFLIEGIEAVKWAIKADIVIDYIFLTKSTTSYESELIDFELFLISDGLIKKITDTNYVIPIVAVGNYKYTKTFDEFVIVLDNVKDNGNIGTIIRTSNAFGINTIISSNIDTDFFQRKTIDASRGTVFKSKFQNFNSAISTIDWLKKNNYQIITTSPYGNNIQSLVALENRPVALIVGNETNGVCDEFINNSDFVVKIPMNSNVESLNVGVATGISIYEFKLKHILGKIVQKIKTTLGRDINVTGMLIKKVLDKELKKVSPISSDQLIFLMVLKCDSSIKLNDAQKQFGILESELDLFFKPLMDFGYLSIDNNDVIKITSYGEETIAKYWSVIEDTEESILNVFSEEEKNTLRSLISKMQNHCIKLLE